MADPPNHFFKFIPPDSKFNLSIPKSFLTKLDGWRGKKAILRRACRKWAVHIGDGGVFGDGWRKFVVENGVQEFDIIVFKHQGNMVFDFFVFDPSTCERQYPDLPDNVEVSLPESDSLHTHERSKRLEKRKWTDYSSQSKDKRCFVTIMTPYLIRTTRMHVPMNFARSNGLTTKGTRTQIVLVDEAKRTWPATLHVKRDQIRLAGWRKLMIKNDLKVGDACMLKLVENGKLPVFNFYNLGKKKASKHVEVKESRSTINKMIGSSLGNHPYFILTMKPSYRDWGLCLPVEFSKSNHLKAGKMILRNDKSKLWKIQLKKRGEKYYNFGRDFGDFWDANGLKVGDDYKFVLVEKEKGKLPIMNVSNLEKKPTNTHMQVKKETGSTRYFISTMKPYSFEHSRLNSPPEFLIPNGKRMGEMILKDDKGRSWKVQLNKSGKTRFYLGCGFRDFFVANGLRKGDLYKFELVENEKDKPPIVNFSCEISLLKDRIKYMLPTKCIFVAVNVDSVPSGKEDPSYYIGKVNTYSMYLPSKLARTNGLLNKEEMILKNGDERSWTVGIKHERNYCYIARGWKEFCAANGLKKGDRIKLELVSNGEIAVVEFKACLS